MLYFPLLNPIIFQPLFEKVPATAESFTGRAQCFPSLEPVQIQVYTDGNAFPVLHMDFDDGTSVLPDPASLDTARLTASDGNVYDYLTVTLALPVRRTFRLRLTLGEVEAVSGCITTEADVSSFSRLSFGSGQELEFDTWMHGEGFDFRPTVYVPGGFFTSGFTPVIDGEEFVDGNRVSRYLSAWPSVTRDLVLGGAQGIDNRLAAMLNAGFCLPLIEVDGRRYVRYAGASLKALGDKILPCRAWSVTLQSAEGDWSTEYGEAFADGALVDASGRFLMDTAGKWIKTTV